MSERRTNKTEERVYLKGKGGRRVYCSLTDRRTYNQTGFLLTFSSTDIDFLGFDEGHSRETNTPLGKSFSKKRNETADKFNLNFSLFNY